MNVGVVFGMIFTVIVVLFLLVFGLGQLTDFFCLSSDAQVQKAIRDVENRVEQVYNLAEGSSMTLDLNLPSDLKFCFIDPLNPGPQDYSPQTWKNWYPDDVYITLIQDNNYTLWYTGCSGQNGYRIKNLKPKNNESFCIKPGVELYLVNKGQYVEIDV
jgi:hypothetical protein